MKKLVILLISALSLTTLLTAHASLFLKSQSGGSTCNPDEDWCIAIKPDSSIVDNTASVSGTVFATIPTGKTTGSYDTALVHSDLPFYDEYGLCRKLINNMKLLIVV